MFADDVVVIGVAGRDELESIQTFIGDRGVDGFPHIVDDSGDIWQRYDVRSQPAFVFIDDDGTIVDRSSSLSEAGLGERIEALIAG